MKNHVSCVVHRALCMCAVALLAGVSFGATCTYNGAWDTAPTGETDEIVIQSGELTWGTSLPAKVASWTQTGGTVTFALGASTFFEVAGDVSLTGGTWTHSANANAAPQDGAGNYRLWVKSGGAFTVGADATISAVGKGYRPEKGPGRHTSSGGGSYGGRGGSYSAESPKCYGSFRCPEFLGSGGAMTAYGSVAGGAIRIVAGGALTVNGRIDADASPYKVDTTGTCQYYAGSGGSIWLTGATVAGSGTLTAQGGAVSNYGPGGAGRIAVHVTDSDDLSGFTPIVNVRGRSASSSRYSAGGTYYVETKSDAGVGTLTVYGISATAQEPWTNVSELTPDDGAEAHVKKLVLSDNAQFAICTGTSFRTDEIVDSGVGTYNTICLNGGTLTQPLGYKFTTIRLSVREEGSQVAFQPEDYSRTLTASGATGLFIFDKPFTVNGNLMLKDGAKLTHSENSDTKVNAVDVTVNGNLSVDAASSIDVSAKGFAFQKGPGATTHHDAYRSASHGGKGGLPGNAVCYGSIRHPVTLGSGGDYNPTCKGGGAAKLVVTGATTLDGLISADAAKVEHYPAAGGSVWLVTGTLSGQGTIRANGGTRTAYTTIGGGGGRVSVQLTGTDATFASFANAYEGAITAYAGRLGASGKPYAAAGTVYLQTAAQADGRGTLIVDNDGSTYVDQATEIGTEVTEAEVGDVIVRNGGRLRVLEGNTLKIAGDIANTSVVQFEPGATLELVDASRTSTLTGNLTLDTLLCEAPGKTISFAAGETTTIAAGGALTLTGTEESPITLQSTEEGTVWTLALGEGVSQSMDRLQVSDSIATGGTATALNSSGTNVSGWNFINVVIGELLTWTGAAGDNWNDVGNWDKGRAPIPTDKVLVPSGLPNMPKLYSAAEVMELEVAAGAELKLNGYDLTVDGPVTAGGPITAADAETLTVRGDVDFSANGLTRARATLALAGDDAQSVKLGGRSYWAVDCSQAAAPTFVDSFATRYFTCMATEPKTLVFTTGLTATVDELQLSGVVEGAAALQLVSSAPGSAWNLKLRGLATVAGVTINDCNAASGQTVYAATPSSGSGCANIEFGIVPRVWTGAKNADFSDAGNWEGGNVPGADDLVVIAKGGSVTISAATTVRELVVGGGDAVSLTVSQPLTVGGSMQIGGVATVTASEKVTVGNSLVMNAGAKLTHPQSNSATATHLFVEVGGDFVLDEGAAVDVIGKGFAKDTGPGHATQNVNVRSASHGGSGMAAGVATCYGSIRHPVTLGSGGHWDGSYGGGSARLVVGGRAFVNGTIAADGSRCEYYSGAGGSVWLVAGSIEGSGTIHANGGDRWHAERAVGGGGRISVQLTEPTATFDGFADAFDGAIYAHAGRHASDSSVTKPMCGGGTVYLQKGSEQDGEGTLIIENGGCTYTDLAAVIEPNVTETDVGSVIIKNGGSLEVKGAATLTVRGDWNNTGTFRVVDSSTLRFAGANIVSHIVTPLVTPSFVCEEPYKVIRFATNDVAALQISAGGLLRVQGSEEDEDGVVSLLSETDGTPWKLRIGADVTQEMQYITVADSDATVGAMASAMDSTGDDFSKDHNWSIVTVVKGELITWTGAAGSAFGDVGNWDLGRAPLKSDKVKIPAGCANYPTLGAAVEALELEVEAGASLSLGGFDLTVKDNLKVAGALVCSGFETITVKGLSDFTGSQVTPAHSTLLITGSDNARFMPTGTTFNDVRIVRGGNDISVFGGFTANRFEVKATAAAGVAFEDGMTVRAKEVSFDGLVDGVAALELMSVEPGSKWKLVASDATSVRGVRASDCDARGGVAFRTEAPSTATGCENWVVVTESFAWTGEEDTEFTNANNWAGGVAPGANDFVEIASAATITLSEPWTVGALKLGGSEDAVKFTATAALMVAGTMEIGTNATVVLDASGEIGNALVIRAGGVLTHDKNGSTEVNKLNLSVGGNVTIDRGGKIDVKGKGYAKGKGPGKPGASTGASHGGRGGWNGPGCVCGPTYGSVFEPVTLGSGGVNSPYFGTAGGGAVKLVVAGTLTVNGAIDAEGADDMVPQMGPGTETGYYTGAGGSIWLDAACVEGIGRITVEGGLQRHGTGGGGGRIAIYTREAGAPSDELELTACAGRCWVSAGDIVPTGGPGTIYLEGKDDESGAGRIVIRNPKADNYYGKDESALRIPAEVDGDPAKAFSHVTLDITENAWVRLADDLLVDEMEFTSGNTLYLNGHTLTIRSLKHRKRSSAKGYDYTGTVSTGAGGAIRFLPRGLMLFVR